MAAPVAANSISAISVCSVMTTFSRSWTVSNSHLIHGPWRGRFNPRLLMGFMSDAKKNYSALKPVKRTKWEVAAQSATVRDEGLVTYDRLIPCPRYSLPSRVEHLLIERNGNVVDVICEEFSLPH